MASFYFYMVWEPMYILLIILSTLVDYFCGLKMGSMATRAERKPYMLVSMISNIAILGTFKYYNFFTESVNDLLTMMNIEYMIPVSSLLLPLGISFYTFQTMSYSLDIYKGKTEPEKHLGKFSLYVTFFPQLVAGPIERAKHLISQFHFNYTFSWRNMSSGLRLIFLGLFKKIVIADQISPMVGHVFSAPGEAYGISIYIACMLFVWQVFCDFSGYSDIAKGSAKLLGIELIENFRHPFYAKTLSNFWAQWHVSLMNWFRDYIMFPMVKDGYKWPIVFMMVFLISGFWHGANWTFVVWGVFNGLMVVYAKATHKYRSAFLDRVGLRNWHNFRHVLQSLSILHIFSLSGVFFRAKNIRESWMLIQNLFNNFLPDTDALLQNVDNLRQDVLYMGKDPLSFFLIIFFMIVLEIYQWNTRHRDMDQLMGKIPVAVRYAIYTFVVMSIVLMSNVAETPFIYFQF
jgi:alginate O-acetyltransferase complex protein AlgI